MELRYRNKVRDGNKEQGTNLIPSLEIQNDFGNTESEKQNKIRYFKIELCTASPNKVIKTVFENSL